MAFQKPFSPSDLKVSRSSHLIEVMKVCENWRSRSFLDLGPRSCTYKNSNRIFSETTLPIWTKLFWKLSGTRKWKSDEMMLVTWPRWPPCPYMVKSFKNLLLWSQQADYHETWYVTSGTPAHHSLFKWWPSSDLDLFYGKVKFGKLCFSKGKSESSGFFRNYCSLWPESW